MCQCKDVHVKFQIFHFLCFKGVVSRERGNEGLISVARELLVSLLISYFYNVFNFFKKIKKSKKNQNSAAQRKC